MGLIGLHNDREGVRISIPDFFNYFDRGYKERTGNPGLFDASQTIYLQVTRSGIVLKEN
jgi:hypothetical protein